MKYLEALIGPWVIRHRLWLFAATLVVSIVAASGMRFLTFNNDLRAFFSEENPQLQALEELENTYNKIDNVYFTVAPKDGDIFSRETLAAIEELLRQLGRSPIPTVLIQLPISSIPILKMMNLLLKILYPAPSI